MLEAERREAGRREEEKRGSKQGRGREAGRRDEREEGGKKGEGSSRSLAPQLWCSLAASGQAKKLSGGLGNSED